MCVYIYIYIHTLYTIIYIYIYIYISLARVIRVSSCQGSQYFAVSFAQ